jgi:radical SAM protein with 4Fe4S-binding SPASM domain
MVAYAKSKSIFTSVLTNATELTDELAQELIDLNLDRIVFSFDAVNKEIYESIRIRSKFESTIRNILNFVKLNHEQGHHTHVCASMVSQERNRQHIEEYRLFFARIPVDKVFVNPLLNLAGTSGVSEEIDMSELRQGARENWPICRVPWQDLTVNWDGEVSACPVDTEVVYSVGNVKDATLQEMWNNERMRQFRRAHLTKDYSLVEENGPLCGNCNCLWLPEYDLRDYQDYAIETIYREAVQFAHQFVGQAAPDGGQEYDDRQKYENLLAELGKVEQRLGQK